LYKTLRRKSVVGEGLGVVYYLKGGVNGGIVGARDKAVANAAVVGDVFDAGDEAAFVDEELHRLPVILAQLGTSFRLLAKRIDSLHSRELAPSTEILFRPRHSHLWHSWCPIDL